MSGREAESKGPDCGDAIDPTIFAQILEMDEDDADDGDEFSRSIVYGFFAQAEETFEKMDKALEESDLEEMFRLGHFLKGSAATLGMEKVKKGCEKIQHYGARQDDAGDASNETDEQQLEKIRKVLKTVRVDYADAERRLKDFYDPN